MTPRWRCGVEGCRYARRSQPVDAMGEYDDIDVAMEALAAHYAQAHPDQTDNQAKEVRHAVAA